MVSTVGGRGKRVRDRQRAAHLVLGLLLVASIYVPTEPGTVQRAAVEWFVAPGAVIAGIILWQWPKIRRLARRSGRTAPARVGVGDNGA